MTAGAGQRPGPDIGVGGVHQPRLRMSTPPPRARRAGTVAGRAGPTGPGPAVVTLRDIVCAIIPGRVTLGLAFVRFVRISAATGVHRVRAR